jgi:hypothetical protein
MKNKNNIMLALVAGFIISIGSAQAANMSFTLWSDYLVNLPTTADSSNDDGYVWLGNFGSSSSTAFSLADVQALAGTSLTSLLDTFRPVGNGYQITNGSLLYNRPAGDPYYLGGTVTMSDSFVGQDAYVVALAGGSQVWATALAEWKSSGTNSAILIGANDNFVGTGDPASDFGLDSASGTLIFGTQTVTSITASAVAVPEPSVTTLLILGAAGLVALRHRRVNA